MYTVSNVMKIFLKSIIILLFITLPVFSEIIKEIQVSGNKRVSSETIKIFSEVKLNSDLNRSQLNNIIKNLYSTEYFKDVSIKLESNILYIYVEENPIIQSINFVGLKNKRILKVLNEQVELKEKNSFIKNKVKKDENKISNILRSNGFYFSKVSSKFKNNNNNTIDLIYEIDLGERAFIKKISFIGDKKIKENKLRKVIVSEEAKFWKFISNKKYLDIKRVKLDQNLLYNFYRNKGYYDVSIESSSAKIINQTDFELIFNINAGKKYYFRNITLELPSNYSSDNFSNIISLFDKLKNKVYSLKKIEEILKEIDNIALSKQFEFITAKYNEKIIDNNKIDLNIKINESEKIYVNRVKIFGNYSTQENVIRNTMLIDEGDPFNEILLNNSINDLKYKNIFQSVNLEIEESDDKLKKDIIIKVEEKPTGEISAGAGAGTSGTQISFGIAEKNYAGTGVKLDTSFLISDTTLRGKFSVDNPNYKNSDRSLRTILESTNTDQMSDFGYETTRTGLSFGTSFEQFRDVYFSPSFSNYYEKLETFGPQIESLITAHYGDVINQATINELENVRGVIVQYSRAIGNSNNEEDYQIRYNNIENTDNMKKNRAEQFPVAETRLIKRSNLKQVAPRESIVPASGAAGPPAIRISYSEIASICGLGLGSMIFGKGNQIVDMVQTFEGEITNAFAKDTLNIIKKKIIDIKRVTAGSTGNNKGVLTKVGDVVTNLYASIFQSSSRSYTNAPGVQDTIQSYQRRATALRQRWTNWQSEANTANVNFIQDIILHIRNTSYYLWVYFVFMQALELYAVKKMLELVPGSLENREQRQRMLELVDDNPSVITTVRSRVENKAAEIGGNRIIRGLTYWLLVAVFRGLAETIRFQIGRPEGFTQVDIMDSIMRQDINPTIQHPHGVSTPVSSGIPFSSQSSELLTDFRRKNDREM